MHYQIAAGYDEVELLHQPVGTGDAVNGAGCGGGRGALPRPGGPLTGDEVVPGRTSSRSDLLRQQALRAHIQPQCREYDGDFGLAANRTDEAINRLGRPEDASERLLCRKPGTGRLRAGQCSHDRKGPASTGQGGLQPGRGGGEERGGEGGLQPARGGGEERGGEADRGGEEGSGGQGGFQPARGALGEALGEEEERGGEADRGGEERGRRRSKEGRQPVRGRDEGGRQAFGQG